MARRKTKLTLNPKKRKDERKKSKQKINCKKYIIDAEQLLNETVTRTYWTNRRHHVPMSVPKKHVSKPLKSPCKRTFSEKKRSRIFDSGGRSPSTKKFRISRNTPLKSPIARQCNTLAQRPHVATKLFEEKRTKTRHRNGSLRDESVFKDHDYANVNRENDSEQYSDLGLSEIHDSDKEEECLKTLTELEDHCYATVKSEWSVVNGLNDSVDNNHSSDLRVSEAHDSEEEEGCFTTLTELEDNCHIPLTSDISIVTDVNDSVNTEPYSDLRVSETHGKDKSDEEECLKTLTELAPTVLSELKKYELQESFLHFFREVADRKFPLTNIAFLLWLDVVNWYKNDVTSSMRYMEQTKKFWKLGWKHFGGKFCRFMTGFKNTSDILTGEAEKGACKPENSDINFVIPSLDVLRNYTPYGTDTKPREPGICCTSM